MIIDIPDEYVDECIIYLKSSIGMLCEYSKIKNTFTTCECATINQIINKLQREQNDSFRD